MSLGLRSSWFWAVSGGTLIPLSYYPLHLPRPGSRSSPLSALKAPGPTDNRKEFGFPLPSVGACGKASPNRNHMGICPCSRKRAELVFAQTTACLLTSAVLQEERRRNKLWISSPEFRFFSVTGWVEPAAHLDLLAKLIVVRSEGGTSRVRLLLCSTSRAGRVSVSRPGIHVLNNGTC